MNARSALEKAVADIHSGPSEAYSWAVLLFEGKDWIPHGYLRTKKAADYRAAWCCPPSRATLVGKVVL